MSDNQRIPTPAPADKPSLTIKVDGAAISGEYQIQAVVVSRCFNKIASAELHIFDGDPAAGDFKISNTDDFIPGKTIEIFAGYHGNEEIIFKGIVIRHGIRVSDYQPSVLKIDCKDSAVKLTSSRKNAYFYDVTDADIIEELAAQADLNTEIEDTAVTHTSMVQFSATDWDFILTRAEANGKQVLTHDGKLVVKAPKKEAIALHLTYGGNMLAFEAVMDARDHYQAVKSYAWNPAEQQLFEIDANAEDAATTAGNLSASDLAQVIDSSAYDLKQVGLTDSELQEWANSKQLKTAYAKTRGRIKIQGFAAILPGQFIQLNGVGERFNGEVLVSAVHHELSSKNWETHISFGLSADFFANQQRDIIAPPANGLLPAISGLQIGLVKALAEDPDGEDRIQLCLPMIDPSEEGVWARVATLDAGNDRGSFFRPEIDDEVIVGFLNDDPRNPIVLGMLNSSAKPAPLAASDDNHEKGFVTRSGMQWLFNDDAVSLTINTPNGNSFVISDEQGSLTLSDENDNTLVMNSDGISVQSAKDLTLQAKGKVTIKGKDVAVSASASLKATGGTEAELSSSATTIVKGALVQIN